jgi:hypothetical protein
MNRSRSIAAALSLLLLAGAGACSSDDSGDKAGATPSGSVSASGSATTASTPAQTPKTLTEKSSSKAEKYVNDTFAGSGWLKSLDKVKVDDNRLVAETTLGSDKRAKSDASEICRALSAYEVAKEDGFMGVVVKGKSGKVLVERKTLSKGC